MSAPATARHLVALDTFIEHRACEQCQHPVNDQGMGEDRGWIHTLTGSYRCPPGTAGNWATPAPGEGAIEAAVEAAIIETEQVTREACEDEMFDDEQMADAEDKAYEAGRNDMFDAVALAFTDAMADVADDAPADTLRAAMQAAWTEIEENRTCPRPIP